MIEADFHTHTTYSDGKNTPEEMILAAIAAGIKTLGITDHSYTDFDDGFCMKCEDIDAYFAEVNALKEKYKDKIKVFCGIEQDLYSGRPIKNYDYVIGSCHYVDSPKGRYSVDHKLDVTKEAIETGFSGDSMAFAEAYFDNVSKLWDVTGCNIVGHFDILQKFHEREALIDRENPRYIKAWTRAADVLLSHGVTFEINTGAMARGYRTSPYPDSEIYTYLREHGAKFVYSSDSHSIKTLGVDWGIDYLK